MTTKLIRLITIVCLLTAVIYPAAAHTLDARERRFDTGVGRDVKPLRHLIICVDGIGHSLIEEMRLENRFKHFGAPGRMVAPFPTLTNVSMTEIMQPAGAGIANGYEDSFYDAERNRIRGTLFDRFRRNSFIKNSFRELFDYHPSALKSGLGYAAPPFSTYVEALTDLVRLKQKFNDSKQPVFYAYLGATDSLAHVGGKGMVKSYLKRLDDALADLNQKHGAQLAITIFSDHGNHFRSYRRADLQAALRTRGFKSAKRIGDDMSYVLPQFGLVGSAVIFTHERRERRAAEALRVAEGVDFSCYEENGVVHLLGGGGEATIERRGNRLRYNAVQGDPLELLPVVQQLKSRGRADSDGFIEDADWYQTTLDSARPDAVRRIYESFGDQVRNPANVIVNLKDGYYTGSRALDVFAFLKATHGNIGREQSLGFVISTARTVPPYVRAEDVWASIGTPVLKKTKSAEARRHGGRRTRKDEQLNDRSVTEN